MSNWIKLKNWLLFRSVISKQRIEQATLNQQTIGIYIKGPDYNSSYFRAFLKELKGLDKIVKILVRYEEDPVEAETIHYKYFTQKEINWYGKPISESVNSFVAEPFNLLLSLDFEPDPTDEFIIQNSLALLRAGSPKYDREVLDLVVSSSENCDISTFIPDLRKVLNTYFKAEV
jgi:hypothetical protein